jgi:hypothetical protein
MHLITFFSLSAQKMKSSKSIFSLSVPWRYKSLPTVSSATTKSVLYKARTNSESLRAWSRSTSYVANVLCLDENKILIRIKAWNNCSYIPSIKYIHHKMLGIPQSWSFLNDLSQTMLLLIYKSLLRIHHSCMLNFDLRV